MFALQHEFETLIHFILLSVALDSDVTALLPLVGFSSARIMSWWRSIFLLWSALFAVWKTFSSPSSLRSFNVSSFTIWIVGARTDFSCFFEASLRLGSTLCAVELVSLEVFSSSRFFDGRHPIIPRLKHSLIFPTCTINAEIEKKWNLWGNFRF